uniref:DoxX family protein n=1 Tax=Candidatus Planktophila sp. TaxID=2175601 RepID=UPI0040491602
MNELTAKESKVGRGMAYMLLITGAGHFIVPGPFDELIPGFLPGEPRFWTYLSGVAELIVALMLLAPLSKKIAGKALRLWGAYLALAVFIAVYPANINMAIEWSSRDMPEPLFAYLRLPLQFGLFYWAWMLAKDIKIKSSKL